MAERINRASLLGLKKALDSTHKCNSFLTELKGFN